MVTVLEKTIEQQDWLAPVETSLQKVANVTLDGKGTTAQLVRNFLHGTWLGHPLHPVLTDLPIGVWTAATIFDARESITGDNRFNDAADALVGIGLIGAAGAAVTGLNDWHHTDGTARRVGVLHGLLNAGSASLFLASWLLRRRGNRSAGRILGLLGMCTATASAYLGGKLVYEEKIGVDHSPRDIPEDFVNVLADMELKEQMPRRVTANGVDLVLIRRGGKVFALADACAHLGGPLSEGELEGVSIRCPWHGSRYSIETGEVLEGPSAFPQPCLETRVYNGQIAVRARRGMPHVNPGS